MGIYKRSDKMNSTFLICGYPRSRTMWLSRFLTVPGESMCTHEATEFSGSASEFWNNAERYSQGVDVYGNSDSANVYVLPALLAMRPMTRVVWVSRDIHSVAKSMRAAGMGQAVDGLKTLKYMFDLYIEYFDLVVDFNALSNPEICRMVWEFCLPDIPWDWGRWGQFADRKICYSKENPMPMKSFNKFLGWVRQELHEFRKEQAR